MATTQVEDAMSSDEEEQDNGCDTFDSSDEEDIRNTIGNVPVSWYDDQDHVGYDWSGEKVGRKTPLRNEMEEFMARMDDPDYWRKVNNPLTGEEVKLTDLQLKTILNIQQGKHPQVGYNPYQQWVDLFSHETMLHPVTDRPEHKRSFIPSKLEKQQVSKMVHSMKMGWMKPKVNKEDVDDEERDIPVYDLWADNKDEQEHVSQRDRMRMKAKMTAPKMSLPTHEESYNPPPEYLMTPQEKAKWDACDVEDRRTTWVPQKYSCLRHVPAYDKFVNERFERCLDLYLAPRQTKMKLNVNPEDLLPKLPRPEDLRPFPTTMSVIYKGHTKMIRCVTVEPERGEFLASGSDDKTIRIWELATGRCVSVLPMEDTVHSIQWCPNQKLTLIAAAVGNTVVIVNCGVGDKLLVSDTRTAIAALSEASEKEDANANWQFVQPKGETQSQFIKIQQDNEVRDVTWHAKGDYLASVSQSNSAQCLAVHQLSKTRTQFPFSKPKGIVQRVLFHPFRPELYVATQKTIRIYNLAKQTLTKKLQPGCRYISCMQLHPKGDNLIVGSYDYRLNWFDLDLSTKPYKTLKHHRAAIRGVSFHKHYPLFASCSDDGSTIISHGRVSTDLLQSAVIVPVKLLRGHAVNSGLGVLDCEFHPTRPWIVTSGADSTLRLWTDS